MSAATHLPEAEARHSLRPAQILTGIIIVLAVVATLGGLFIDGLYTGTEWSVMAMTGQDWFTLGGAVPALVISLLFVRRGSAPAAMVLAGVLSYMLYTYTGATFAYDFNTFFLLYVALFSLSLAALVTTVTGVDAARLVRRFDTGTPIRAVAIFLGFMAFMLTQAELREILPFITEGRLPHAIQLSGSPTFFVYGLDLGVVVPLLVLAAVWLWRREPRGYLLAGCMLVNCAVMGFSLVFLTLYAWLAGGVTDGIEWIAGYVFIAFGGLGMATWFLRHCRR